MDYDKVFEATQYISSIIKDFKIDVGIVAGTGLKNISTIVRNPIKVSYKDIPHFPKLITIGHGGEFIFGKIENCNVAVMTGRFHSYEGIDIAVTTIGIRVMQLLGIKTIILTNAAGGVNPMYRTGDIMIIEDHINFLGFGGKSPLVGPNDDRFGPRFPPLNGVYDQKLIDLAFDEGYFCGFKDIMKSGVYCCLSGPSYETPSEISMLYKMGVDAVGMSTVPEVVVAAHGGLKVLALSLITNECLHIGSTKPPPNQQEVIDIGNKRTQDIQELIKRILSRIQKNDYSVNFNYEYKHKVGNKSPLCFNINSNTIIGFTMIAAVGIILFKNFFATK